jgi:hypothetical protein
MQVYTNSLDEDIRNFKNYLDDHKNDEIHTLLGLDAELAINDN